MQSWGNKDDGDFEVIMDSMASLKLLWEAAAMPGGKRAWADMALEHSRTVARDLFRCVGAAAGHSSSTMQLRSKLGRAGLTLLLA